MINSGTSIRYTFRQKVSDRLTTLLLFGVLCLSGCGEPLSETEKIIRENDKEIARINKRLGKMQKRQPERFIEDGRTEKTVINNAVRIGDWQRVEGVYQLLLTKDTDLGTYPEELEANILKKVKPLSGNLYKENYLGYKTLSVINPSNSAYTAKSAAYKNQFIKAGKSAISKLNSKHDKIENITWYHHPNEPIDTNAYLYIGQKPNGAPWLRLRVSYSSQYGWLFVQNIKAWHDGILEPLTAGPFERKSGSIVREWQDVAPTELQIEIMRSLASAKESTLRFEGKDRHKDVVLTRKNKEAIMDVLEAFEAMKALRELEN